MSYLNILSKGNTKAKKTMEAHPELEIRTMSLPCIVSCPFAGKCKKGCYATQRRQAMPNCVMAYNENLDMVLKGTFFEQLRGELIMYQVHARRNGVKPCVRLHDSGDFITEEYLDDWLAIMEEFPRIHFYAYTKCVSWIKARRLPQNFEVIFSYGGLEDDKIRDDDRHAHVVKKKDPIPEGYTDASDSEYFALCGDYSHIALHYHGDRKGEFRTI